MKILAGRKSGLGAGAFQCDGTGTRRNGGQVDAEWRLPSLVTTSGVKQNVVCGVEKNMSESSGKNKTQKTKIKVVAKNPQKIKAAIKAWVESSEKNNSDPFELNQAPAWAENALAEAVKTTLPGKRLPTSGEWDVELIGELLGRQQAIGKLYSGEIPMGPETKTEYARLEKFVASQPKSPAILAKQKAMVQDLQIMIGATQDAIPQLLKAVLSSSHEDTVKFQNGLLRGMNLAPDELTAGKTFQRHTRTYWVLGTGWRIFSKCRSVAEVYRLLCQAVGENKIGSLKHFEERIAKKIGMKFSNSGRPSKGK
jgi:hypothetical protein